MTRKGLFESNKRKREKIERNKEQYESLKKEQKDLEKQYGLMDDSEYFQKRNAIQMRLHKMRRSSPSFLVRICSKTGRSRGVFRMFGLCGSMIREHFMEINSFFKEN